MAKTRARPCRRTRPIQPLTSEPAKAPTPGAAYSSPTVPGATAVETGPDGREDGPGHAEDHGVEIDPECRQQQLVLAQMPEPLGDRTETDRVLRAARGTRAGRLATARRATPKVATSIMNTTLIPNWEMSRPARAGPTTAEVCHRIDCRARAAGTSSIGTSIGRAALRAGQSKPWKQADAAVHTKMGQSSGWAKEALRASPTLVRRQHDLGDEQHPAAVLGVGHRPAGHRTEQEGSELHQADQADHQGGVGDPVGLVGHADDGELAADTRHHLAEPQPPEVPVAAQRRDVGEDPGHPATIAGSAEAPNVAGFAVNVVRGVRR